MGCSVSDKQPELLHSTAQSTVVNSRLCSRIPSVLRIVLPPLWTIYSMSGVMVFSCSHWDDYLGGQQGSAGNSITEKQTDTWKTQKTKNWEKMQVQTEQILMQAEKRKTMKLLHRNHLLSKFWKEMFSLQCEKETKSWGYAPVWKQKGFDIITEMITLFLLSHADIHVYTHVYVNTELQWMSIGSA